MKKRFVSLLATFAVVLVACSSPPATAPGGSKSEAPGQPRKGGTLVIGSNDTVKSLAYYHLGSSSDEIPIFAIMEPLVYFKQGSYTLVPRLAEKWDSSPDGLTWTIAVRKGVKFHDGIELTADDVKYTFEVMKNPATMARQSVNFAAIKEVNVKDKYTVEVVLAQPYAPFVAKVLTTPILPKQYHTKVGIEEFNLKPIGTGPFKLKEWNPEDHVTLERFDGYWDGPVYLDKVVLKMMPEASVRMLALRTGDIQLDKWFPPPAEVPKFKSDPAFHAYETVTASTRVINLNNKHPFLSDKRVRQALMYAIDRESLIKNLFQGQAVMALHNVPPVYKDWYNMDVPKYSYDPAKAKQLLSTAGWKPGPNGTLVNAQGQPFKFTLLHIQGEEETLNSAVAIQKWLKDVGIEMEIENQETGTVIDRVWNKKDFDAAIYVWTLGGQNGDPDVAPQWSSTGNDNQPQYANPKVDELINKGLVTLNPEERMKIYKDISAILAEDVPMLWLMHPIANYVATAKLKGLTDGPYGQYHYLGKAWLDQ